MVATAKPEDTSHDPPIGVLRAHSVVQFVGDAGLVHNDRFRLCLEYGGEPMYLNVGELFIAEP